ncbi:TIGR00268 family protein, partial [bacterium]|nr:TIGR00268 family protein [bacterium]
PLLELGFTKQEIRLYSKEYGLKTHSKPSFACLASRFVYGEKITSEKLEMVQNMEQVLYELNFSQFRVRLHDKLTRIEIKPEEFEKFLKERSKILTEFKKYGQKYITLDLEGYKMGSMNETIK